MTAFAHELATHNPAYCQPDTTLATAASLLWEYDCGILPVVDKDWRVLGVLTDRDICLALATRNESPSQVTAKEVMHTPAFTISARGTANQALRLMREHKVRRLPVVDSEGRLEAVLSFNDLALAAHPSGTIPGPDVSNEEVLATLKVFCAHEASGLKEVSKVKALPL
jgi:CBS domain-containing protein